LEGIFARGLCSIESMIYVSVLFSVIGLFLSLWIMIPAPIFALLPLGVGAPEISPWLIGINAIALLLNWLTLKLAKKLGWLLLAGSALALSLSLIPLLQLPSAIAQANTALRSGLGNTYRDDLALTRPAPFVWLDSFRGIPKSEIRRAIDIPFANPDHVLLKLNVYCPPKPGLYPAIVMIYGGAWRSGNPKSNESFSEYMASQGYTVLAIDYRHAPQYKFPTQIEDVKTALQFIRRHANEYEIDLNRIAIMGRSAGGHLAMLAAYTSNILPIRAVVNYYSPVNLIEGYNNPPIPDPIDSRDVLRSFLGGTPQEFPDLYRQASPYYAVKPNLPPTLLIYGGRDHVVQSKYGRSLYEKLNETKNTAVFIEVPWAEHAFDAIFNGVSNQFALYYTERFLASILR
jgi:acetyl esterase/lipase